MKPQGKIFVSLFAPELSLKRQTHNCCFILLSRGFGADAQSSFSIFNSIWALYGKLKFTAHAGHPNGMLPFWWGLLATSLVCAWMSSVQALSNYAEKFSMCLIELVLWIEISTSPSHYSLCFRLVLVQYVNGSSWWQRQILLLYCHIQCTWHGSGRRRSWIYRSHQLCAS